MESGLFVFVAAAVRHGDFNMRRGPIFRGLGSKLFDMDQGAIVSAPVIGRNESDIYDL